MKKGALLLVITGILCVISLPLYCQQPNDPYYFFQWGLQKIQIEDAWEITGGSSSIKIAVVDTGCDLDHEDLAGKIDRINSRNLVNPLLPPEDDSYESHGTHVAGIIAGVVNNGKGIAGITRNCKLVIFKALDANGDGYVSTIIEAIATAALTPGVKVINCSFGGPIPSGYYEGKLREAVDTAVYYKGIVIVAAAGNDKTSKKYLPAGYKNVIGVTSTDRNDRPCYTFVGTPKGTNYNPPGHTYYEIAAPGSSIYSTKRNNRYGYLSGTSMSTAFVSGVCALLLSKDPSLSPSEVKSILENTADPIRGENPNKDIGKGRVNAYKALLKVGGPPPVNEIVKAVAYVGARGKKSVEVNVGEEVQFYGDESTAPEGYKLQYLWRFGDGSTSTDVNPRHKYEKEGKYKVKLLVYTYSALDTDEVEVVVKETAPPPPSGKVKAIAYVGKRGQKSIDVKVGEEVKFFGDESTAPEGKTLKYLWTFGDRTSSQEANPTHIYNKEGKYTVRLLVYTYDDLDTDDVEVNVSGGIIPPVREKIVLHGYVKDQNGDPIQGATVLLRGSLVISSNNASLPILGRDTTKDDGSYRIEIALSHSIHRASLTASKTGFNPQTINLGTLNPGDDKIINFKLSKVSPPGNKVRIYGKVTEIGTGKPISGAHVYVKYEVFPYIRYPFKEREGIHDFKKFPFYRKGFLVEVVKPGYRDGRKWVILKPGDEKKLNFRLWKYRWRRKSLWIKPQKGFVTIAETTTDKNGNYNLEFALPSFPEPIPPVRRAVIYGKVKDQRGRGISGASVVAYTTWDNNIITTEFLTEPEVYPPRGIYPPVRKIVGRAITDRGGNYRLVIRYPYPWEPIPLTPSADRKKIYIPGPQRIKLTASKIGYISESITIKVSPGDRKRIDFTLQRKTVIDFPDPGDPIILDPPMVGPIMGIKTP